MTEAELEALCWAVRSRWPTLYGEALFDRAHHEIRYPLPPWAKTGHGKVPQKRLRACLDRLAQVHGLQAHLELFLAQHAELSGSGVVREVYEGLIAEPVRRSSGALWAIFVGYPMEHIDSRGFFQLQPSDDFCRLMDLSEAVFIRSEPIQDDWPEVIRVAVERLRGVSGIPQEQFHGLFFGHGVQFQPPVPYEADEAERRLKQRGLEET